MKLAGLGSALALLGAIAFVWHMNLFGYGSEPALAGFLAGTLLMTAQLLIRSPRPPRPPRSSAGWRRSAATR